MNKFFALFVFATIPFSAFSEEPKEESYLECQLPEITQIISICDITQAQLYGIFTGNLPETAIEFPEGSRIPLNFTVSGDILSLENEENSSLLLQKTLYMRFFKPGVLFSSDLNTWNTAPHFFNKNLNLSIDKACLGLSIDVELSENI